MEMKMETMEIRHKIIISLCAITTFYLVFMTINAFITPVSETEEVQHLDRSTKISYNYLVYPTVSTLFPEGTKPLPAGMKNYFRSITDKIELKITGELTTYSTEPEGEFEVKLIVRADDQWEKELDFNPEITSYKSNEDTLTFESFFILPVDEAVQVTEAIVQEIGLTPRSYSLIVKSEIHDVTLDGKEPLDRNFNKEYKFAITNSTIEPAGDLMDENSKMITEMIMTVNYVNIFGYPIEVSTARVTFVALLSVLLVAQSAYYYKWRNNSINVLGKGEQKLGKIRKRYGGKIINVSEIKGIPEDKLSIEMNSFEELVKIADERERPILYINTNSLNGETTHFCIVDEEAMYRYNMVSS